jgi:hypothetical protein
MAGVKRAPKRYYRAQSGYRRPDLRGAGAPPPRHPFVLHGQPGDPMLGARNSLFTTPAHLQRFCALCSAPRDAPIHTRA